MKQYFEKIEKALPQYFNNNTKNFPKNGEIPYYLSDSMKYSLCLPGKRLRPILVLAGYNLLKDNYEEIMDFACAVEMIHAYSLIHDDLPALDNDKLRRGKPTNHVVYGENIAILAGDALLNLAYEIMLSSEFTKENPHIALPAIYEVAKRVGSRGMIAGQVMDVKLEGNTPNLESVQYIHKHKTADLITASLLLGIKLANGSDEAINAISIYGEKLGLAFQMQDDILDLEGEIDLLGKETGMDISRGKLTWPAVVGLEQSKIDVLDNIQEAIHALECFNQRAEFLKELALNSISRKY